MDGKIEITEWIVHVLEFRHGTSNINGWKPMQTTPDAKNVLQNGPRLFLATFPIGIAFCSGFNLGRYWNVDPQRTLYIPAQLLVKGVNQIQIFELYTYGRNLTLVDTPLLN
ncbi:unnamed protein product [Rotaria magnacalcarata]|uniref:Beta-galactosidase galactose-binding domain-containing protein n=1 Tax=Rotaria magnacalcarata TaxID=392030 RepID=A0A816G9U5_9BILA|nr:unnamed protein product [Rotaria magnacalcarata]CAF1672248.1 unnamed protein product [Rotaria magnacalcarata]CAF2116524.1 unnamed protein product [Rotaria magnacalcarata]CAF3906227.1 unnamed protein product [Rotaria magnacalcarata]CAF4131159.1 unnamed protein product [Rotaria magnacalcarata]